MSEKRIITSGTALAVRGNEIDTDRIIPARFMKCVTFDGLGQYAFYDERYEENGNKKNHPFNDPKTAGGTILLANKNFGCGSSREHAPQALYRYGIRAIVAESFAEIFRGNCTTMGIPAVTVSAADISDLMLMAEKNPELALSVDLEKKTVSVSDVKYDLDIPETFRQALITGKWDSTNALLSNKDKIEQTIAEIPYLNQFSSF